MALILEKELTAVNQMQSLIYKQLFEMPNSDSDNFQLLFKDNYTTGEEILNHKRNLTNNLQECTSSRYPYKYH